MRLDILCQLILMFFVYGFLGWTCECLYCSIPAKKFINRGFLLGPICPVYGIGALLVIGILSPVSGDMEDYGSFIIPWKKFGKNLLCAV